MYLHRPSWVFKGSLESISEAYQGSTQLALQRAGRYRKAGIELKADHLEAEWNASEPAKIGVLPTHAGCLNPVLS